MYSAKKKNTINNDYYLANTLTIDHARLDKTFVYREKANLINDLQYSQCSS